MNINSNPCVLNPSIEFSRKQPTGELALSILYFFTFKLLYVKHGDKGWNFSAFICDVNSKYEVMKIWDRCGINKTKKINKMCIQSFLNFRMRKNEKWTFDSKMRKYSLKKLG